MNKLIKAGMMYAIAASAFANAPAWTEGASYQAGALVTHDGKTYQALVTHTAYVGAGWTPSTTPTLWKLSTGGALPSASPVPTLKPTATPLVTVAPTATPLVTVAPTATPLVTVAPTATPQGSSDCSAKGWSSVQAYLGGAIVAFNGRTYKAKWWTQGNEPSSNSGDGKPWQEIGVCGVSPTNSPAPTLAPTNSPAPTLAPTNSPAPTLAPTNSPAPTLAPTNSPAPTLAPTNSPAPTLAPTNSPAPTPIVGANPNKPQIVYAPAKEGYPTDAQFEADEAALALTAGGDGKTIEAIRLALSVRQDSVVDQVKAGSPSNPPNVKRVESFLSEARFNEIFPVRHKAYTYENLLKAIAKFPAYCGDYDDGRNADMICRKLLATSFAHTIQEVGANEDKMTPARALMDADHANPVLQTMDQNAPIPRARQGLWYLREIGYREGESRGAYQDCYRDSGGTIWSIFYPCGLNEAGQPLDYFGRGSKQLSWNYNYGPFSKTLYGDVNVLLDNPGRVADSWLNFASAIWFAVYPQSPKPPMTWVVDGTWIPNSVDIASGMKPGFGATIQIINGGLECGSGTEKPQALNRIAMYKEFAKEFGVEISPDEELGCAKMTGFQAGSSATTKTYLEQNWGYNPKNPGGVSWACSLVNYQTPFNLGVKGDYKKCVDYIFRGQVYYKGKLMLNNAK